MTRQPHPDRVRLLPWATPPWLIDGILIGLVVPAAIAIVALAGNVPDVTVAAAGVAALVGMFAYLDSFVRAGQSVRLS